MTPITTSITPQTRAERPRSHDEGYIQGRSQGRLTRQRGCPSLLSEGEILIIPEFQP